MRYFLLSLYAMVYCTVHAYAQCSGPVIINYPYQENFELSAGGWVAGGTNNDWAWGAPNKPTINSAGNGAKCWVTGGLTGSFYNLGERSYVESPCFSFLILDHPYIHFKIWWESEQRYDGGNLQYSLDAGNSWTNVGSVNDPVNCLNENWYNYPNITNLTGLTSVKNGWTGTVQPSNGSCLGGNGSGGWVEARHCMTNLAGQPSVKFRFTFGAGTTCNDYDGLAFDDIYIQNAPPIVAAFVPSCSGDNTYTFNDISTNCPDAWSWDFGDPSSGAVNTSSAQNPTHAFSVPGNYTVTLIASNICSGSTTAVRTVQVLGATASVTPVDCQGGNNGSATLQIIPAGSSPAIQWNTVPVQTGVTATNLTAGSYTVSLLENGVCPAMATVIVTEPSALQTTTSLVNAACGSANGAATITASGGTSPYTYVWSPAVSTTASATGLSAGNYVVTVIDDQGCTDLVTFQINGSPGVQATVATSVGATCFGSTNGSVTAVANGGTAPFAYAWSPSGGTGPAASALAAGTYTVTITDANLCTATATATVGQPPVLQHTATVQQATCGTASGSASVVEMGGTAPYTYAWSPAGGTANTANNLAAGAYVLSVTDQQGCTDTVQVTITNTPPVQLNIANVVPVLCFGAATGSAMATVTGGTAPFTYTWSPSGGAAATATGLAAGSYQVIVTDAKLCTATATVNISQPTALMHTTTSVSAACNTANGSATVMETGGVPPYNYLWSPQGGTNPMATGLPAANDVVTVTDSQNCTDTVQINIGNIGGVQAIVSATASVTCFGGQDGSATVMAMSGALPYIYIWSPAGGNGPTASGLAAGNYFITVTDANLCVAALATSITQPPAFQHTVTVQPSICGGANGAATVVESGGTPPYTYVWSPSGGNSNVANDLAAGNYVVSITDQQGCTDTVQVTVGTLPSVQAAIASTVNPPCFGGLTGSATVAATSGLAPYTYSWLPAGSNGATANGLAAGNYTVTVTDANQCTATATAIILQPAALQHTVMVQSAACGGATGSAAINESGGTSPYTYVWSPTGGNASTANGLSPGNYTVSVSDQQGCVDSAQVTIGNIPGVQASIFTTTNAPCFGSDGGSATVNATVGMLPYSYAWSPAGGADATTVNLTAGTYIVTVTDANACTATATATITQPTALAHLTTTTPVSCGGLNGTAAVQETGGTEPYTFAWSPAGGTGATASGLGVGSYVVTVTDSQGCSDTIHLFIDSIAQVRAAITNISPISCFGADDGTLTVLVTGGMLPYTYAWSASGGSGATLMDLAPGAYTVTVTDASGCKSAAFATVPDAVPIVSQAHATPVRCAGEANGAITVDTTTGGVGPYRYALNQGGFGPQMLFTMLPGGNYMVHTQDANGCVITDSLFIAVPAARTVDIGPDTTINIGDSLLLTAVITGSGQVVQYTWMPPATVNCATCPATFAHPVTTTTYLLQITDSSGCLSSASRTVRVKGPSMYIPNAFAPAANGENNHFTLYAGYGVEEIELLQVYDRWGELVFQNRHFAPADPRAGWDGKVRGQIAGTGVYAYLIQVRLLDGSLQFFKGDVTLIR